MTSEGQVTMPSFITDLHPCKQVERLKHIDEAIHRLDKDLNGNGRCGVREELIELRTTVRGMVKLNWVILGALVANLVGVVYRLI